MVVYNQIGRLRFQAFTVKERNKEEKFMAMEKCKIKYKKRKIKNKRQNLRTIEDLLGILPIRKSVGSQH